MLDLDAPPDGVVVAAVGDMVCSNINEVTPVDCHHQQVSDLLVADPDLDAFLALGDLQWHPAPGGSQDYGGRGVGPEHGFEEPPVRNSQRRIAGVFGLARLVLTDTGYWWSFVDETGRVRDSGSTRCH